MQSFENILIQLSIYYIHLPLIEEGGVLFYG